MMLVKLVILVAVNLLINVRVLADSCSWDKPKKAEIEKNFKVGTTYFGNFLPGGLIVQKFEARENPGSDQLSFYVNGKQFYPEFENIFVNS